MDSEKRHAEIAAGVEAVGLSDDAGQNLKLDQATFFRCVEDGNLPTLRALIKNRSVDTNAYNDEGVTALHLAVYKYEERRNLEIITILLEQGADLSIKAAVPPSAHKISLMRHENKTPQGDVLSETKMVTLDQKTPLLVALELKSALYVKEVASAFTYALFTVLWVRGTLGMYIRYLLAFTFNPHGMFEGGLSQSCMKVMDMISGWEYRHWDDLLRLLADATIEHYDKKKEPQLPRIPLADIQRNWRRVFESGKHETIEVWAEGKYITVLKLLLSGASHVLKMNIESAGAFFTTRLDIKDASFNVLKTMMHFLYTGEVEEHFMEHRGLDLLLAAHKYGIKSLTGLCEDKIEATQDNWIKLLSAAMECNSDVLTLKCAESIKGLMDKRHDNSHVFKRSFSDVKNAPNQLFSST